MMVAHHSRILLVEDNPADSLLMSKILTDSFPHTEVIVAEDGNIASDRLFNRGVFLSTPLPDLIFLDLNLPGKNGIELLKEIKTDSLLKTIPVVIFSSSEAIDDIQSCYEAHANAYFTKPSDLKEFMSLLQSIYLFWFQRAKLSTRKEKDVAKAIHAQF